jgi:hypothetical protein
MEALDLKCSNPKPWVFDLTDRDDKKFPIIPNFSHVHLPLEILCICHELSHNHIDHYVFDKLSQFILVHFSFILHLLIIHISFNFDNHLPIYHHLVRSAFFLFVPPDFQINEFWILPLPKKLQFPTQKNYSGNIHNHTYIFPLQFMVSNCSHQFYEWFFLLENKL